MLDQDKFFDEGMKACIIGIHIRLNPCHRRLKEYESWDNGWHFADKLERYSKLIRDD